MQFLICFCLFCPLFFILGRGWTRCGRGSSWLCQGFPLSIPLFLFIERMGKKVKVKESKEKIDGGDNPDAWLKNYKIVCRKTGIRPDSKVVQAIEGEGVATRIAIDSDLGPMGTHALFASLSGKTEGMLEPYKVVDTIRLWRANIGEEGSHAIANWLRDVDCFVNTIQFMDCNVNALGCKYLAKSLTCNVNTTLQSLSLDHNQRLGSLGLKNLSEGLYTNSTLRNLSVAFCGIDSSGGKAVKTLLRPGLNLKLESLCLNGNQLCGEGLQLFCKALGENASLKVLDISDNAIDNDEAPLQMLCAALKVNTSLTDLRFHSNPIGSRGGAILRDSGAFNKKTGNSNLKTFTIDRRMDQDLFEELFRAGGKAKGKGKVKKKKK